MDSKVKQHIMDDPHHARPGDLVRIADAAMEEQGFATGFSADELAQSALPAGPVESIEDQRALLWSSIDNDQSRDLDQVEWAEARANGSITIRVGVADVDSRVQRDSPLDRRAAHNPTSIYTPVKNYPMLPTGLSEHLTSLEFDQDRPAIVTEFTVRPDGTTHADRVYRAWIRNRGQLTYGGVSNWIQHPTTEPLPPAVAAVPGLDEQLRLQAQASEWLESRTHHATATSGNRAEHLVDELMTTTNEVNSHFLWDRGYPSIGHHPADGSLPHVHTTAPNRLEGDLVMQRILKACMAGQPSPYTVDELDAITRHCSEAEQAAHRVEGRIHAAVAAASMADRVGQRFKGTVRTVDPDGALVRLDEPPVEGWLSTGLVRIGEHVTVAVQEVNIEKGHIELTLAA